MESTGKRWTRLIASAVGSFWFVFAVFGTSVAFAALTFSGTLISGDASSRVDSSGTLSLGTASATAVMIGSSTISGNSTLAGPAVFQDAITQSGAAVSLASTTINGSATTTSLTIGAGSVLSKYACSTGTWDSPSLASSGNVTTNSTTTDLALTGAVAGDLCFASLNVATTTSHVLACSTGAASSTVTLLNTSAITLDYPSATLKVCYIH